ncbi:MAG: RNA 2',3'-cyclic phosphodiesterase [Acidimicrobiia bacterium]
MTQLRRGFVAVVPPAEVLDAVEALVASARLSIDGLRWAAREQWHCTLQFFGPVPDAEGLVAALEAPMRAHPRFGVRLGSSGAFPSISRGTVLWLGSASGGDGLAGLAAAVSRATGPLGFVPEVRPFRPHLTVARSPAPVDLTRAVAALGDGPAGPTWPVAEVVLLDSDTLPTGSVHREVARIPLLPVRGDRTR